MRALTFTSLSLGACPSSAFAWGTGQCMLPTVRSHAHAAFRAVPTCSLDRLPHHTLREVIPLRPTPEKWAAVFGQTVAERQGRIREVAGLGFAMMWVGVFASRTVLGHLAWRALCVMAFTQGILIPVAIAFNKTLRLLGDTREARMKTRGALFSGR